MPGVIRTLLLASPNPAGACVDGKSWDIRQQHRRGNRQAGANPEQAGVNGDLERADGEAGGELRHDGNKGTRQQYAEDAPAPHSTRLSASSVRLSAPAFAPRAARTASSPSRRTERARIRFATFEQAMMNTTPAAASSMSRTVRAGEVI